MSRQKRAVPPMYIGIIAFSLGLFVATLLNSGKFSDQPQSNQTESVLFELQGREFDTKDLSYGAVSDLYRLEQEYFEQKLAILQRAALYLHLDKLAANRGVSRDTIREELIPSVAVIEEEVAGFYENNKAQISQPYFQVKEAIKAALAQDRLRQADRQLIRKLEQARQLSFHIKPPVAPMVELNTEGQPALGQASAEVTIVEFTDYQCPHCKTASETLLALQQKFPDRIRLVTLELPILGDTSDIAAKTALCAHQQQQYWPFHKLLFAHQDELIPAKINELAIALGVDTQLLKSCLVSHNYKPLLENSRQQAKRLGLTGTPAIFINGIAWQGQNLHNSLEEAVKEALASVE